MLAGAHTPEKYKLFLHGDTVHSGQGFQVKRAVRFCKGVVAGAGEGAFIGLTWKDDKPAYFVQLYGVAYTMSDLTTKPTYEGPDEVISAC